MGNIGYWQLEDNKNGIRLGMDMKQVKQLLVTRDQQFSVVTLTDESLELWNQATKLKIKTIETDGTPCPAVTHNNHYLFIQRERGKVLVLDMTNPKEDDPVFMLNERITQILVDGEDENLFIAGMQGGLIKYNLRNGVTAHTYESGKSRVASINLTSGD